jgi:hypothetical protein
MNTHIRRAIQRMRFGAWLAAPVFAILLIASRTEAQHAGMTGMTDPPDMMMTGPLGISTDRQGSGTTWQPEAVLMPFRHALIGKWDVMSHWNVFAQYNQQFDRRGASQFGSVNWSMVMASRPFLGGRLQLRAMNSVEAATVGRCGYPLLLQSGETCHGAPNHDRQHPHDFFMEAAALYERALSRDLAWSLYVAPSGEPAAGPVAFMHRASAMNDPLSNVTHHWQDASHITFGVVTGAVYGKRWKLEGSTFNGREPDEHRWNFDLKNAKFSSYAGRVTINPSRSWSMAGSFAYIEGSEPSEPEAAMHRTTLSVLHARTLGSSGKLAAAAVWGANRHLGDETEHSLLGEANIDIDARNAAFLRVEHVKKSPADLAIESSSDDHYPVTAIALGVVRDVADTGLLTTGLGVRGSVTLLPESLRSTYGSRRPLGLVVFLRMRAKAMTAEELAEMHERMRHAAMGMKM